MLVWGCRCGAFGGLLYEVEGNISLHLWPPNQKNILLRTCRCRVSKLPDTTSETNPSAISVNLAQGTPGLPLYKHTGDRREAFLLEFLVFSLRVFPRVWWTFLTGGKTAVSGAKSGHFSHPFYRFSYSSCNLT